MIRWRIVIAVFVALLLFAWQDVLIWQRIFEHDGLWQYAGVYHDGWRVMRDALVIVGIWLLWPRWIEMAFYSSTLFVFSINGFVDILYFWLDGRALPLEFVWTCDAWHICIVPGPIKGAEAFIASVVMWGMLWAAGWFLALRFAPRLGGVRIGYKVTG